MKANKKIIITINTDGNAKIAAYCLTTDSWQDHLFFMKDAERFLASSNIRAANRSLRAALLFLFAHFEGVVDYVILENKLPSGQYDRLCDKTKVIREHLPSGKRLPYLNIRLGKAIRDILVHPGIEKALAEDAVKDETTVYSDLTLKSITDLSSMIANWLDSVCRFYNTQRFTDTKNMAREWADIFGDKSETTEV